jgi:anti-sigma B factor antagonist
MKYTIELADDVCMVWIEGDLLGGYDVQPLYREVDEIIGQGVLLGAVDLSEVRYLNSSGLGTLTTLLAKFRNKGGELVIIRPSEKLKKLLIITKLTAIFSIADDLEEAILKLRSE